MLDYITDSDIVDLGHLKESMEIQRRFYYAKLLAKVIAVAKKNQESNPKSAYYKEVNYAWKTIPGDES